MNELNQSERHGIGTNATRRCHAASRRLAGGESRGVVAEFIEEHLAEEISLATLAELVNLSLCHFARAFKQSFGNAPASLPHGSPDGSRQRLLQRSALSVTQISIQVGFRETSSFTRAYRRFTGVTPSEFRRQRPD